MADLRTIFDGATLTADWAIDPVTGGLVATNDLETAVILSLFTDCRAGDSDFLPDGTDDRRGCWLDWKSPEGIPLGSRLWLYTRAKSTEETRRGIEEAAASALQHLLDDGVCARIDVGASYMETGSTPRSTITLRVVITRDDGSVYDRRFDSFWQEVG
jgi:phage gp46-like protein